MPLSALVPTVATKALDVAENLNEMLDYSYQQVLDHITTGPSCASTLRRQTVQTLDPGYAPFVVPDGGPEIKIPIPYP